MTRKQILITGAGGRVARAIAPWIGQFPELRVRWQSRGSGPSGLDWMRCNPLTNPEGMAAACFECDAVLHLAGVTPGTDPADFTLQAPIALSVMQAAKRAGVPRMLVASSAAVYGPSDVPIAEVAQVAPVSEYGQSKVLMEQVLLSRARGGSMQIGLLRLGNVAGADSLLAGQPRPTVLDRFEDGTTPVRSYISPQSLARVIRDLVLLSHGALPPVLNVAAPGAVAMADLMQAASLPWTPRAAPADVPKRVELCTRQLQSLVPLTEADAAPAHLTEQVLRMCA